MKRHLATIALAAISLSACQQKVEYVSADWVQLITPTDGETMLISAEQDIILFQWGAREGATYTLSFDDSQDFDSPETFGCGADTAFTIKAGDLHKTLKKIDPDFKGTKRFFWKVDQTIGDVTKSCWRYFNAVYAAGSFVDDRDGVTYNTITYDIDEFTTYEITTDNLRATKYSDGKAIPNGYKTCNAPEWVDNEMFVAAAGCYYTWEDAVRMTWNDAEKAYRNGVQVQGICPDGWHLPNYEEWQNLISFFGGADGGALKICSLDYWQKMPGITNSLKFNLLPTGQFWGTSEEELCTNVGLTAFLWSSTPVVAETTYAWGTWEANDKLGWAGAMCIWAETDSGVRNYYAECGAPSESEKMFPVRCIKNYTKTEE